VVVNMASLNGSLSFRNLPAISHMTNKAAIIGMTRQLAMEGSEHGIRVNSISPGLIESARPEESWKTSSGAARCATGRSSAGSASRRTW
jgi:NAD(P)-dependent dehydrogenase (short-subunit alcohol dehydrogenase family)